MCTSRKDSCEALVLVLDVIHDRKPLGENHVPFTLWTRNHTPVQMVDNALNPAAQVGAVLHLGQSFQLFL